MKKTIKRLGVVLVSMLLAAVTILSVLQICVVLRTKEEIHYTPDYQKIDILPILQKEVMTDADYELLYKQTGLTRLGVEPLLESGQIDTIIEIQNNFFGEFKVENTKFGPYSRVQTIDKKVTFAPLRDGDIIISSSTFVSGFRCGHAVLVVDAEKHSTLNAAVIGEDSYLASTSFLADRANFIVLRPNLDAKTIEKVVFFAENELVGLPYSLFEGIFSKKYSDELLGSNCSHIVWYAFKKYGIDIDSDKGFIITPKDIANSDQLSVVQVFGFEPNKLWK